MEAEGEHHPFSVLLDLVVSLRDLVGLLLISRVAAIRRWVSHLPTLADNYRLITL